MGGNNGQGIALWYRRHKPRVQLVKKELEIKSDSKPRRGVQKSPAAPRHL